MSKENHRFSVFFIWLALLCFALVILPVSAQDGDQYHYEPITKVDLGVTSLELKAGESYTFKVTFEPENNILDTLDWYVTDERVISVDPLTNTVTALSDGEARIFAESMDEVSYAVCNVTVGASTAKSAAVMKSGADFTGLSQRDIRKIKAPTLVRYLDFVTNSALDAESFDGVTERFYDVLAVVKSGCEAAESRKAAGLGLESEPLKNLQSITLRGTLKQLLAYVKGNSNLTEIIELGETWFDEPESSPDEEETVSKTIQDKFNLKARANELSSFTTAHNIGLTGDGSIIAVIDTGFVSSHEQFLDRDRKKGRFIKEACFSVTERVNNKNFYSVCDDGKTDNGNGVSLDLSKVYRKNKYNHGTHVAGIAAGRDGVAPDARIIGIQATSELRWTCSEKEKPNYRCTPNSNLCCAPRFVNSNVARAYDYLLEVSKELAKKGEKIDVVNMSFGGARADGKGFKNICDNIYPFYKNYFDKLIDADILPVVSAGNLAFVDSVGQPACISNAFTVAALTNHTSPYLASYSNFNIPNVDIAAPGHRTYASDAVVMDKKTMKITCTKNCYGLMDGTSSAAPMVSGAVALIRQLYPGMAPQDAGKFLKDISEKRVNKRVTYYNEKVNYTYKFSKPVLDLRYILSKFTIPDNRITAEDQNVKITFDDIVFSDGVTIKIQESGTKRWINNAKYRMYTDGKHNFNIEIDGKGNFKAGRLYRVEITRKMTGGPETKVIKYFYPFASAGALSRSLTAASGANSVSLNANVDPKNNKDRIAYNVYNGDTGRLIKSVYTGNGSKAQTVSGLINGHKYYVTAQYYRDVTVNKKSVRVYGSESDKVWFMPMNKPYNCKVSAGLKSTRISCAADPAADGILVLYRSANENQLKPAEGIASQKGKFSVEIKDESILKSTHQFVVMKYKLDNGWEWPGSATTVTRPFARPVKNGNNLLVNFNPQGNTVISNNVQNIVVTLMDFKKSDSFSKFCESTGKFCSGKLPGTDSKFFLVLNYQTNDKGMKLYSPGNLVSVSGSY